MVYLESREGKYWGIINSLEDIFKVKYILQYLVLILVVKDWALEEELVDGFCHPWDI